MGPVAVEGTTPALHGDTLVVTWDHIGGQSFIVALDKRTGTERWRANRDEIDIWATPLIVEHAGRAQVIAPAMDRVYGYDLETGDIVWQLDRDTPYVPSPLLYDDALYVLKSNDGILSVCDPATGSPHYQLQRLVGVPNIFASPVGAAGRVYIPGRDGTTLVIAHGARYEVLASNTLDDRFDASPAIVGDELYLRGEQFLYKIAAP
jgi:outer membrane protein assembly factor BamB